MTGIRMGLLASRYRKEAILEYLEVGEKELMHTRLTAAK